MWPPIWLVRWDLELQFRILSSEQLNSEVRERSDSIFDATVPITRTFFWCALQPSPSAPGLSPSYLVHHLTKLPQFSLSYNLCQFFSPLHIHSAKLDKSPHGTSPTISRHLLSLNLWIHFFCNALSFKSPPFLNTYVYYTYPQSCMNAISSNRCNNTSSQPPLNVWWGVQKFLLEEYCLVQKQGSVEARINSIIGNMKPLKSKARMKLVNDKYMD